MNKIKVIVCKCGEDVYENDYGTLGKTDESKVYCINCGEPYNVDQLVETTLPEIIQSHGY